MEKISFSKINSGYILVDQAHELDRLTRILQETARVGMDTEADSLHCYFEKVCLIQLSFSGKNYIIDTLAGISLSEFLEVLSQKELIFHGADYDLRMLKKSFGFRPKAPIFDTMLAAQVLGYEKIGLAMLVERFFGLSMPKTGQKAAWSQRPLPARLLIYASDDTKYLEAIADALSDSLQKLNRTRWHKECCERTVKASELPDKNCGKEAWRIKGSSRLAPEALVFVRELWKWRDEEARKVDRPPFMILKNEDLIEFAVWRVKNPQTPILRGGPFFTRMTGERFSRLENAIRYAENIPPAEWPQPVQRKEGREGGFDPVKLDRLLEACKTLAAEFQIQPSFLASRAALTAVVRRQPRSVEQIIEVSGLLPWQAELVAPAIKSLLGDHGKEA